MTVPTGEVAVCEDLDWFTGPEELYRASPIYVGNEMPIQEVGAYARGMDGFVEAWIDREHNGWVNVGFKGIDLEAAQEELSGAFPDEGVVAVALPYNHEELESIRQRVARSVPDDFRALNTHFLHGRVEVEVGVLTEENMERVKDAVGDEPVCAVGIPPELAVQPGPQPPGGPGWTFLDVVDGSMGEVAVFADTGSFERGWDQLFAGDPPKIDFESSIVIAMEIGYSGSCSETRLDDVEFADDAVRLVVNTVTDEMACNDDYNPRTYAVAIDRERLPPPPFAIGRAGWVTDAAQVENDLRQPGATAGSLGAAPDPPPEVGIPDVIETGFPWDAVIDTSCGIGYLGEVNSVHWVTNAEFPDEWAPFLDGPLLAVTLLLTEGPEPSLDVTAGNHTVRFMPGEPIPCDTR